MVLYIRYRNLSKFKNLYENNNYLQEVLTKWTGIKWIISDDADLNKIKNILHSKNIIYDIE